MTQTRSNDESSGEHRLKFRAVLRLEGKTATGIQVPPEVVDALGQGKRPPVLVTIGKHTYRSTVAPYSGVYMLPISAENREAAGVAAGDEVEVQLVLDTQPREVTLPQDFAEALGRYPEAKGFFESLSYSNQRRIVLNIEGAKTSETRQRRIEKAVGALAEKKMP
jgi:hypothetical protein